MPDPNRRLVFLDGIYTLLKLPSLRCESGPGLRFLREYTYRSKADFTGRHDGKSFYHDTYICSE